MYYSSLQTSKMMFLCMWYEMFFTVNNSCKRFEIFCKYRLYLYRYNLCFYKYKLYL